MKSPVLGITLGDINGIGPEITFSALRRRPVPVRRARFVVIGDATLIGAWAHAAGMTLPPCWRPGRPWPGKTGLARWSPGENSRRPPAVRPGRVTGAAGRLAGEALLAAADACRKGALAGMVTAPVCKQSLQRAGYDVPGQTEWLAALSGTRRFGMLLAGGGLRVVLATRHLPLESVPQAVTRRGIMEAAELLSDALKWMNIPNRRLGICALNPHAGDGGILGDHDQRVVRPAVRALQRKGIDAQGPIPADVIFYQARTGRYGGVVALYHDQGLAPLKMIAFRDGVNVTLGLPFVRTSPDHGTAFDIAGKHRADYRSMTAAIRLAVDLVHRANPWHPQKRPDPPATRDTR